jgi:glycosyltransferase involved in cell wall biosynthesis
MTRDPLINILIRTTANRQKELLYCLATIKGQSYRNIQVIICTDIKEELDSILLIMYASNLNFQLINVKATGTPYHWNFYCNNLKERVTDGWFFYLDDDDHLHRPTALGEIAKHLTHSNEGVICQFNRGNKAKPEYDETSLMHNTYIKTESIVRGKIGGSCIFLHHSQKDIANWDGKRAADYRFIKAVAEKIPLKFVPVVVVQAGNNGRHGK